MRRSAQGHTIVELLVVISISSVTLALVAMSLHTILRTTSRFRDEQARATTLLRLDLQFRTDVHETTRIESSAPDAAGMADRLTLVRNDDARVEYRIEGNGVHRLLIRQGVQTQRDTYRLGVHSRMAFEMVTPLDGVSQVGLLIEQLPAVESPHRPLARTNAIRAVIGGTTQFGILPQ